MRYEDMTKAQLIETLEKLSRRVDEFETLESERRRELEELLMESEEKYRILVENAVDGIYIINLEGFEYVNPAFEKIIGYKAEEVCNKDFNFLELIYPEDRPLIVEREKAREKGKKIPSRYSFRIISKKGEIKDVEVNTISLSGKSVRVLGILRDRTEQTQVEKAFKESEEKYRTLVETLEEGIGTVDEKENFIFVNRATANIFGYPKEELLGKNLKELMTPEEFQRVLEQSSLRKAGKSSQYELTVIKKDGDSRIISITATPIFGNNGNYKGSFGMFHDVTERKQADQLQNVLYEIANAVNTTEDLDELFKSIHGHLGKVVDTTNFFIALYERARNMIHFPYFVDEKDSFVSIPVGKGLTLISYVIREDKPILVTAKEVNNMIQAGEIETIGSPSKIWLGVPLKVGKEVIGAIVVQSYTDANLYTEKHLEILKFVSDQVALAIVRKKAEEDKEKIQSQLIQAQKMEAIGVMAGGVAHDFNNLLTTIQGCSDMMAVHIDEQNPLYRDLKDIREAASHAADLTRQLLLFSRKQPMQFVSVNFNTTVGYMLKMLHRLIGEDIRISTELDPGLWTVCADRGTMEQVIMNLAVNARDAMPEGGKITIQTENVMLDEDYCRTIPGSRPGPFIRLSMEDTGIGMDSEILVHIFEPFFSTKGPGKGTGLGLSVVYGIVQQHDGWINVYSEPGKGSTFKIYIPATSVEVDEDDKRKVSLEDFQGNGERILVVEDEKGVREFVRRALGRNGYTVFTAANAWEALNMFEKERRDFQLVFSDVVLPDKTGIEVIEELLSRDPNIRVLLSSGYTDHKSQWPIIELKGYPFLQKPYTLYDLLRTVKVTLTSASGK